MYAKIETHPFLRGLTDGTLPEELFRHYVLQDAHYLRDFGRGLALITRASAVFTAYGQKGMSSCFGSSEAFLKLQETLDEWNAVGRPDMKRLRLRLTPITQPEPTITTGKLYRRRDHWLHVWMDMEASSSNLKVLPES